MSDAPLLPDCRARDPKGIIFGKDGNNWVPIFCANCGEHGGLVPAENMTFVFYLCTPCAETYGAIAGMMMMPDEVFWERLKQEQLEKYGRFLNEQELAEIVKIGTSPLAKLIKERE